jgi:hypothetical protein
LLEKGKDKGEKAKDKKGKIVPEVVATLKE